MNFRQYGLKSYPYTIVCCKDGIILYIVCLIGKGTFSRNIATYPANSTLGNRYHCNHIYTTPLLGKSETGRIFNSFSSRLIPFALRGSRKRYDFPSPPCISLSSAVLPLFLPVSLPVLSAHPQPCISTKLHHIFQSIVLQTVHDRNAPRLKRPVERTLTVRFKWKRKACRGVVRGSQWPPVFQDTFST